jgi:thiamine biosynthesis lipoprotein
MMSSRVACFPLLFLLIGKPDEAVRRGSGETPQGLTSPFEAVEPHMGTLVRIKVYAQDDAHAQHVMRAAFDRFTELDEVLSEYKPASELNRVTRIAIHHPVAISNDLFRVLAASQKLSEESDGAFDITLGPVTHLWREARKTHRVPDPEALQAALASCGYRKVHLDTTHQTVSFDQPGMQLDAGGIAKGYAADEALMVLSKLGIHSALVAASGDLAFSDAPPGQAGWKIGIDSFDRADAPFTSMLLLANGAVSTSGDTEQHLDIGDTRYSHLIDPKSGVGLTRGITVTILAKHGIDADGMTKAVSVLGEERGLAFVEKQPEAAALIVTGRGSDRHIVTSSRFPSDR